MLSRNKHRKGSKANLAAEAQQHHQQQQQQQQQYNQDQDQDQHQQQSAQYPNQNLLYSAPTVDTLGDESSLMIRPYATPRPFATPTVNSSSTTANATATSSSTTTSNSTSITQNNHQRKKKRANNNKTKTNKNNTNEFQLPGDAMTLLVRTIPVAERSAFDIKKVDLELLDAASTKVSPSPQHLELIRKLQSVTHIRQLAFSPSCGPSSDVLYDQDYGDDVILSPLSASLLLLKRKNKKRDGRYRSIDPVEATRNALPPNPPLLSNKKHRLPMRADVGFPNTPYTEIQQKQAEIQHETEWEEASPRLIVLVTSDDLGTAVEQEDPEPDKGDTNTNSNMTVGIIRHRGMPFAGPEIWEAKQRNQMHFVSRRTNTSSSSTTQNQNQNKTGKDAQDQEQDPMWLRRTRSLAANRYRYSVLAPPLDASYSTSSTLGGWRPRPFHDRLPGMQYSLACPLQLEFPVGNIEPLVGCLSLYRIITTGEAQGQHPELIVSGKASEDFYFPAGDWKGRIAIDTIQGDADLTQLWHERQHKALFAHDPLVVPTNQLYMVLQVFKATHLELAAAYLTGKQSSSSSSTNNGSNANSHPVDRKSFKKRIKKHFQKGKAEDADLHRTTYRASAVWEQFGSQFLSPLCFGVAPLYQTSASSASVAEACTWPNGQVQQNIDMYCYPPQSESQEEFVQRLQHIVGKQQTSMQAVPNTKYNVTSPSLSTVQESSLREEKSIASMSENSADFSTPSKKKGLSRFLSPKKTSKKDSSPNLKAATSKQQPQPQAGNTPSMSVKVAIFTSSLDVDFLQAMLKTPPELAESAPVQSRMLPKILVDASGESAIMMDPKQGAMKRSSLVRLPTRPGGYLDASDFREVLFLPPRPPKNYDLDVPPSYRSLLNLLYLYPRLLRLEDASDPNYKRNKRQRYTIRIRLIQSLAGTKQDSDIVESKDKSITSFQNPVPWAGSSLLKSVYTRIPGDSSSHTKHDDVKTGIPLKDEFKLRLPMVLDGNYFLHFTLFAVDLQDDLDDSASAEASAEEGCGLSLRPIAETTIPLSSSSTRDPALGVKATTIIPNGCHRLKLGVFQLQLETRLISSVHVSDPALATGLREFPLANDETLSEQRLQELALVANRSVMSRKSSKDQIQQKVSYSELFATASGSALIGHFQPLLFMHLSNLVNRGNGGGAEANEEFLVENIQSFLKVCSRVKAAFFSSHPDGDKRIERFFKAAVDSFDEAMFQSSSLNNDPDEDAASDVLPVEPSRSIPSINPSESAEEEQDDDFDGGAIRRRKKDSLTSEIDIRINRTFSAMESTEKSFSRVAYGATKTDRMRLEAELDVDSNRFTHLVDDDETVVTVATAFTTEGRMAEAREAFEKTKFNSLNAYPNDLEGSYVNRIEDDAKEIGTDFSYTRSLSELGFAKRVRTAAKVMLAPCVTANLSTVFSSGTSPRHPAPDTEKKDVAPTKPKLEQSTLHPLATPGSDLEENGTREDSNDDLSIVGSAHHTSEGTFRSPWHCPQLNFSIAVHPSPDRYHLRLGRGDFVYESVLMLWIRAWMDQIKRKVKQKGSATTPSPIPVFPDSGGVPSDSIQMFHAQLDILLPLCLKSIALRYGQAVRPYHSKTARVIVDQRHVSVLDSFVEMLALSLMGQGLAELTPQNNDKALQSALNASDHVLDFIIGLLAVLHPAHMEVLVRKLFVTLRNCETAHLQSTDANVRFAWTSENLHRVKCSRQLRLRAVEKLSVLPNFVALNYPLHFSSRASSNRPKKATWTAQVGDSSQGGAHGDNGSILGSDDQLPQSGWLAEILATESLSICAHSCEAVVAEAMAHIETQETATSNSSKASSLNKRPTASLKREDLLMFQSMAIHAITCVHELLLRRHAMDKRYQKESSRGRIAALFAKPIFEKSLTSIRWLARMESTHRVRSLWLLCFVYILQEAPESLVRDLISSYSNAKEVRIHRFIRLLRLGSSTFQSFIDQPRHCMFPSEIDSGISPWLLQESFNTICATIIVVVDECASPTSSFPEEQKKMIQGILDLLLHVLTTPQSAVTHLRAVGGAIQALEKFGTEMFLEITGGSLQHWLRIILGLMNSISLSVRSIAVDFVVSLLGSAFDMLGNIDELALIFATVLPEVVAREIALCSVSGHVKNLEDAEKSVWPLRRSFADVEDADPLDDDRVDPQLSPVLSVFCRACQAVIDGVLVEMRLQGSNCTVVGTRMQSQPLGMYTFDADEESLFEAASFFVPETAPIQRIRWLMTLKSLHKAKGQWLEAADSLTMCARTISDSIPHLKHVWRPSRFSLWSDSRRSLWLSTVGEETGNPELGNEEVMSFAGAYLEPNLLSNFPDKATATSTSRLPQPTVSSMCSLLTSITKEAVSLYLREEGMDGLAYTRLESLLKILMGVLDDHGISDDVGVGRTRLSGVMGRKRFVEEEASLRKVIASISGDMTKLAERLLLIVEDKSMNSSKASESGNQRKSSSSNKEQSRKQYFIRVLLSGKKPTRFLESTTLPTFLEWNTPCICRVPKDIVEKSVASAGPRNPVRLEEAMCSAFGKPLRNAFLRDGSTGSIVFRLGGNQPETTTLPANGDDKTIFVDIGFVQMKNASDDDYEYSNHLDGEEVAFGHQSKHFVYRKTNEAGICTTFVEMTVANTFPCPLSRQRTLLTSEFASSK